MHVKETSNLIDKQGMHKRPAFLTILPSFGMVPLEFHIAAMRLATPMNARSSIFSIKGEEIGTARNFAVEAFLQANDLPEYFFMYGDDMIPDWDALIVLYEEAVRGKWDALSALYHIKVEGAPTPILWREGMNGPMRAGVHFRPGEVVPSDIVGLDFTLIRPEVFRKMSKPYFLTGPKRDETTGAIDYFTEDAYFSAKLKHEAQGKIGVHTGVRCNHMDVKTGEIF